MNLNENGSESVYHLKFPKAWPIVQTLPLIREKTDGLDVGVEDTALCVVDDEGGVLLQCEVPTDP